MLVSQTMSYRHQLQVSALSLRLGNLLILRRQSDTGIGSYKTCEILKNVSLFLFHPMWLSYKLPSIYSWFQQKNCALVYVVEQRTNILNVNVKAFSNGLNMKLRKVKWSKDGWECRCGGRLRQVWWQGGGGVQCSHRNPSYIHYCCNRSEPVVLSVVRSFVCCAVTGVYSLS